MMPLATLPLAFLIAMAIAFAKSHRAPALWGLGAFAIVGTLAAAATSWRDRSERGFKVLGWLSLAVSSAIVALLVVGGAQEIAKNRSRDAAYQRTGR